MRAPAAPATRAFLSQKRLAVENLKPEIVESDRRDYGPAGLLLESEMGLTTTILTLVLALLFGFVGFGELVSSPDVAKFFCFVFGIAFVVAAGSHFFSGPDIKIDDGE